MNSKKTPYYLALAVFCLGISTWMIPVALARPMENSSRETGTGNGLGADNRQEVQGKFCEKLSEVSSKFDQKIVEQENRIQERTQNRLNNWSEKQSQRDSRLAQRRTLRDENLEEHFNRLEERAQTQEQEEAVTDFEKALRNAIENRREAIDGAIESFRKEANSAIEARKGQLDGLIGSFEEAQKNAFSEAGQACQAGKDGAKIRLELHTALRTAKTKLASDRQASEKARINLEAQIQTRKNAIEKAQADFKATMEAAKAELLKVFPEA